MDKSGKDSSIFHHEPVILFGLFITKCKRRFLPLGKLKMINEKS
jgi:hypothetical protein